MNQLFSLQLWHLFKYCELTEVVGQSDQVFVNMLINFRLDTVDKNTERLLRARLRSVWQKLTTWWSILYAENPPTAFTNQIILNILPK